ncbi:hypothetical protein CJ030_MR3G001239 [Morella rubra]|uniref:GRF-type domain-containing protein n=1 Tax=Morella rubra TaxID=262757 RepID=A0A6A1W6E1_9ROSI|nr:hypothetical protein CJ030_MR3G001239 [Morella rubra]
MSVSHITGSSGIVESGASIEGPKCYCDLKAKSTIAFTKENFGRRFWGCVKFKDGGHCNYFAWRDPKMCSYGRRVITKLRAMHSQSRGEQCTWESIEREPRHETEIIIAMTEQHREEIVNMSKQHCIEIEKLNVQNRANIDAMIVQHRLEIDVERRVSDVKISGYRAALSVCLFLIFGIFAAHIFSTGLCTPLKLMLAA